MRKRIVLTILVLLLGFISIAQKKKVDAKTEFTSTNLDEYFYKIPYTPELVQFVDFIPRTYEDFRKEPFVPTWFYIEDTKGNKYNIFWDWWDAKGLPLFFLIDFDKGVYTGIHLVSEQDQQNIRRYILKRQWLTDRGFSDRVSWYKDEILKDEKDGDPKNFLYRK